ncbi:MAG: prefoldin subunit beta [Candidatus Aenigmatarchaeota archaeon]|nr:MAG: prefoldin subunit beta [Candidatus Aenigmarchaeota archaeon]
MPEIPQQAQQMIMQLQAAQQQLQAFAMQRQSLTMQKHEIEKATEELTSANDKEDVYKLSGPIMVRSTKSKLLDELKERIAKIDSGIKRLEDHEKKIAEKAQENQTKLEKMFAPPETKGQAG